MSKSNPRAFSVLQHIERLGNKLPNPTWLFVYLCGLILLASLLASIAGLTAVHPVTGDLLQAKNLLSGDGLRWILQNTVTNFTHFAPVGTVLVAIMGIGVAEHSGLLGALLKMLVTKAQGRLLTFVVVLAGVLSSLAADAGYVVLIPLAGMVFASAGRPPLVGIAAAFAGVSGGFSANLLIGPLDAIMAGISTEAVSLVASDYEVNAAGNYYFIVASTLLVALLGTWVTESIVIPRLNLASDEGNSPQNADPTSFALAQTAPEQVKGLRYVGGFSLVFLGLLALAVLPESGVLRNPGTQSILRSPFISGIVTLIAVYGALCGIIFGKVTGAFKTHHDIVAAMENSMATMASYLVLMFFAAQFVSYFAWTDLGAILAVLGAKYLSALGLNAFVTLVCFILFTAFINLFIGSASAKWALLAPIFVPMFFLLNISPEGTQMAYRIGDSSTNIITPLMPYFGVVVAFAQRYDKNVGIGTLMAMMLPYSICFLFGWACLLGIWMLLGLPLGPGAAIGI